MIRHELERWIPDDRPGSASGPADADARKKVVFLLDEVGLRLYAELIPAPPKRYIAMLPSAYAAWSARELARHPHGIIKVTSCCEPPDAFWARRLRDIVADEEIPDVVMHRYGVIWGPSAGYEQTDLWLRSNGNLTLLRAGWSREYS